MTADRDYLDFLEDMVATYRSIIHFVKGMNVNDYLADEKTRFAVMRGFEILGEAVPHLPDDLKSTHPEIPWITIRGFRNRIIHGYFGVDDTIVFQAINDDIVPLLPRLEAVAREPGAIP